MLTSRCKCGAKYRYPESSIGKRAKCKKCGTIFTLKPEDDEGPIPIADDSDMRGEIAAAANRCKAISAEQEEAEARAAAAIALPHSGQSIRAQHVAASKPRMGTREYFRDLIATLVFLKKPASLISFVVMWVILALGILGAQIPLFGILLLLMSLGWYAAFRFSVVSSAAAGEKEVPMLSFEDGVGGGIVLPLFRWVGTWVLAFAPVIVFMVIYVGVTVSAIMGGVSGIISAGGANITLLLLSALGLFVWPMIVLCVSLGGFETLIHIDLIVPTLVKTFPMYVLTVGIVMGTQFIDYSWQAAAKKTVAKAQFEGTMMENLVNEQGEYTGDTLTPKQWEQVVKDSRRKPAVNVSAGMETDLYIRIFGAGLILYLEIVAMRAIGLYYFHFKRRFAWDWG